MCIAKTCVPMQIIDKKKLLDEMANHAIVITPNNRLSNQLLSDYRSNSNLTTCAKPQCMPYSFFLRNLFKQACYLKTNIEHPVLISKHQQRHIWSRILNEHLLCNKGLLNAIEDAWTRCQQWQINMHHPLFKTTPQTQQFQQWHFQFLQELQKHQILVEEQLAQYVLSFTHLIFSSPTRIIWACFDDFTPEQLILQQTLTNHGSLQLKYELSSAKIASFQYQANDQQDEYLQIINWVQTRLLEGDQKIGIVVPELQNQAQRIQRLFKHHLPEYEINISM
jgi:ATP-dependent helicase/nuclease subunit B